MSQRPPATRRQPDVDVAVVGAGVVGLAVAAELLARGLGVAVFERRGRPGRETTSRHSGVLHAGLYYPTGSLKARLCVEGRRGLVAFCRRHGVPHRACGKLIVATSADGEERLEALLAQGRRNGVEGLEWIGPGRVAEREPGVRCVAGLLSRATGIVDADALVRALDRTIAAAGGHVLSGHEVVGLGPADAGGWSLQLRPRRGERHRVVARHVVNAAGLWADRVAALAGQRGVAQRYVKGSYFWTSRPVVRGLVYPLPEPGLRGLGIHTTVDLAGRVRFGPDTEDVDDLDYTVDPARADRFFEAARRYLPGLRRDELAPDTAGIRPRRADAGDGFADFLLRATEAPGGGTLLTLAGIESPGLTSCLALGREAADRLHGAPRRGTDPRVG